MTTRMRGMQAAFITNGIHLIIGYVNIFIGSNLYYWAETIALVTESSREDILKVIQGARKWDTADVNTGLKWTARVEYT